MVLMLHDRAVVPANASNLAVHVMNMAMAGDVSTISPEVRVYNDHMLQIMFGDDYWSALLAGTFVIIRTLSFSLCESLTE